MTVRQPSSDGLPVLYTQLHFSYSEVSFYIELSFIIRIRFLLQKIISTIRPPYATLSVCQLSYIQPWAEENYLFHANWLSSRRWLQFLGLYRMRLRASCCCYLVVARLTAISEILWSNFIASSSVYQNTHCDNILYSIGHWLYTVHTKSHYNHRCKKTFK